MRTWATMLVLATAAALCSCSGEQGGGEKEMVIAVIPKGTTHVFWQSVNAGAAKAGEDLGVKVAWLGPEKEDDRQQQIALVDNQVLKGVSGVVLAPLDDTALRQPVKRATEAGVPVVIIDSDLKDAEDLYVSFVATDNREGGRIAGRRLGEMLGGEGRVVMLRYMENSASTNNREAGFLEAIAEFPDIEVVDSSQYGGATAASAQDASQNLLMGFKGAGGTLTVDGIFCPNESSTYGMLQTLRRNQWAGTLTFVGFDSSEPLVEGLRAGEIDGLVVQNPFRMGYMGVKTMVAHLRGEPVDQRVDTGVAFITAENVDTPEMQELLK